MKATRAQGAGARRDAKRAPLAPPPAASSPQSGGLHSLDALLKLARWARPVISIDVRSLAVSRAVIALVLLADVIKRLVTHLHGFYSDGGVVPRAYAATLNSAWRWSLYDANGQAAFAGLLTVITGIAALALLLGYRTRIATVLCFVLQASLLNRNPLVSFWSDELMLCILFFACFIPWGARWSVDAALAPKPRPEGSMHCSVAGAGLLLQLALVFAVSGIALLALGDSTAASTAWRSYISPLAAWAASHGIEPLRIQHLSALTSVCAAILIVFPVGLRYTRTLALVILLLAALAAIFLFYLGPAPYVIIGAVALLATDLLWRDPPARKAAASAVPRLRIFFDRDCPFCERACLLLVEFLILPHAEIAPAQGYPRADTLLRANTSWVVIDHDDRAHLKWSALTTLMRRSPLFGILGWLLQRIPGLARVGDAGYDWTARHRQQLASLLRRLPAPAAPLFKPGMASSGVLAAILGLILLANLQTLTASTTEGIRLVRAPLELLRLDQGWRILLPPAGDESGWYLLPGELEDGSTVDVLHPRASGVSYDPPSFVVGGSEPSLHWHLYRVRISVAQLAEGRSIYARYLCRQWNRGQATGHRLRSFKFINMVAPAPGNSPTALEQHVLGSYDCLAADNAP